MPGGCGCAGGSCSCLITAGPGLAITGTGNTSAPFVISVSPTPGNITVNAAGPLDLSANAGNATAQVTLNANATSVILPAGASHIDLLITQGTGGSHTITWPAPIIWPGGTEPVLTTPVGAVDWITLINAGGVWAGVRTGAALQ